MAPLPLPDLIYTSQFKPLNPLHECLQTMANWQLLLPNPLETRLRSSSVHFDARQKTEQLEHCKQSWLKNRLNPLKTKV